MTRNACIAVAAYIAVIVLANVATDRLGLVPIGLGLLVTAGTFFAGAALLLRDWVQLDAPRWVVWAAILAGAALSYLMSNPALALASGLAFLVSELVDYGVFTPLRDKSLAGAVLVSSVVSAPIDTVLFLWLAGFPLTWQAVAGQFIVKTVMALAVAGAIAYREQRRCSTSPA
jgi:uncharacterized PurR-regulated membrane protein YhhQ (DUF165 family)